MFDFDNIGAELDTLFEEARRLETAKQNRALTEAEVKRLKAAEFLRKVMGLPPTVPETGTYVRH